MMEKLLYMIFTQKISLKKNISIKKDFFSYKWNFKNVFLSLPQYKLVYLKVEKYKKTNDKLEVSLIKKKK